VHHYYSSYNVLFTQFVQHYSVDVVIVIALVVEVMVRVMGMIVMIMIITSITLLQQ